MAASLVILWQQEKSIPLSVEMSAEMLKTLNILTVPSSEGLLFENSCSSTAFEFLKT